MTKTNEQTSDYRDISDHEPENPKDFIDVYLTEITWKDFNIYELIACVQDFFTAGTETSSTTMKWIIQYLTLHQDVQER